MTRIHQRHGRTTVRRILALAIVITLAVFASACSSDDGGDNASPGDTTNGSANDTATTANPDNCPVAALDDTDGPIEITLWHAFDALTQEAIEKSAADYNASQSKVKVSVEAQGRYNELFKKYEDRLSDPSTLPDLYFGQDSDMQFLIDSDTVVAASDCIAADPDAAAFYDDLAPVVSGTYSVDGTLWPTAFGATTSLLYTNKAHFERAGVDPSTQIETLADLREVAQKIKDAGIPTVEAPLVMMLDAQYFGTWITGAGETMVNEANGHDGRATESTFDNPATNETLQWMADMASDGLLRAIPYGAGLDHYMAFARMNSSMLVATSRAATTAVAMANNSLSGDSVEGLEGVGSADLVDMELGGMALPGLEKAGQVSLGGTAGYVVAGSDPARIAAAWDFMKFFNSDESQVNWTKMGSLLPVTGHVQQLPELTEYLQNDPAGQLLAIAIEQMNGVPEGIVAPVIGPYDRFRDGLHTMLSRVVIDGNDPAEAVTKMDADLNGMLAEYEQDLGG